eukprot:XP_025013436.1 probable CCR4-associated factor 1 homolog 6 [Ricinus communis]
MVREGYLEELRKIDQSRYSFQVLSINADTTKLIQLGLTLSDENGNIGCVWQFNFSFCTETVLQLVCFHDLRHVVKLLTNNSLPTSLMHLTRMIGYVFGQIVDIKHMVSLCEGLFNGEFGMQKLAKVMEVERVGMAHQAGSDSLLTSQLFAKIKDTFQVEESSIWTIYMVFIQRMQITAATNSYSSQSTLAQDDIPFIHCHHRLFPICT